MCSDPSKRAELRHIGPRNVQQSVVAVPIATHWSRECAAIRRSALNCDRLVLRMCSNPLKRAELRMIGPTNVQQSVVARRIGTDWSREIAAIRIGAPNCVRLVSRMCSNSSKRPELLQIGPRNVQQSVVALTIVSDWSRECAAIRRSAVNYNRLVLRMCSNPS